VHDRGRVWVDIATRLARGGEAIADGLFAFLFAWGDFLFALTLTTEGNITPVTLGIYTYLGAHISNWSAVMATAMLASIPAIILLVIAQKYIAAGATGGAVK
jgi:multiple sugar transport system permease protein